ncbi:methyltransferase domain-containing protein [Mycobacterium sp. SMC-2]|uniref:class I SAM-dependent methyltransferase n=1 Tax=Mycobacterium sp. SMC-2 TaxID=2857058 RepID=UPI0021B2C585|nr:class I SAM-dependent methyltransferase [Mycobacterium sp. SMC-2]UXA08889.1 methyltransferase domain-containing protein [Mycobacterium sp. SMC-2]
MMMLLRRRTRESVRWYQVVYRLAYRLGLIIWQRGGPPDELVSMIEGSAKLEPGRALDIGCGTGTDTIYLATHGWQVTAVDMVPKALAAARRKSAAAGVAPRFVQGDVTRLHDLGIGGGYTLLLDFGCFHTLPEDRRCAYVTSISRVAAPGATLLLWGFKRPPPTAPMHAGMTLDEVRQRFGETGWRVVCAEPTSADSQTAVARRAAAHFELWWYQLTRDST